MEWVCNNCLGDSCMYEWSIALLPYIVRSGLWITLAIKLFHIFVVCRKRDEKERIEKGNWKFYLKRTIYHFLTLHINGCCFFLACIHLHILLEANLSSQCREERKVLVHSTHWTNAWHFNLWLIRTYMTGHFHISCWKFCPFWELIMGSRWHPDCKSQQIKNTQIGRSIRQHVRNYPFKFTQKLWHHRSRTVLVVHFPCSLILPYAGDWSVLDLHNVINSFSKLWGTNWYSDT